MSRNRPGPRSQKKRSSSPGRGPTRPGMGMTRAIPLSALLLASVPRAAPVTAPGPAIPAQGAVRAERLQRACEGGNMDGCLELGALERERGNQARASELWRKACHGGNMDGCSSLGVVAMDAGDAAGASEFFKKACEGGDVNGCLFLKVLEARQKRSERGSAPKRR